MVCVGFGEVSCAAAPVAVSAGAAVAAVDVSGRDPRRGICGSRSPRGDPAVSSPSVEASALIRRSTGRASVRRGVLDFLGGRGQLLSTGPRCGGGGARCLLPQLRDLGPVQKLGQLGPALRAAEQIAGTENHCRREDLHHGVLSETQTRAFSSIGRDETPRDMAIYVNRSTAPVDHEVAVTVGPVGRFSLARRPTLTPSALFASAFVGPGGREG